MEMMKMEAMGRGKTENGEKELRENEDERDSEVWEYVINEA